MKEKDKEYHILAKREGEGILLEECKIESNHHVPEPEIKPMFEIKEGTNLSSIGTPAYELVPTDRKDHVKLKEIKLSKGPSKSNSNKFRSGWENTFGGGGMKN